MPEERRSDARNLPELIERVLRRQEEIKPLHEAARLAQKRYDDSSGALVACYDELRKALGDRPVIYRGVVVSKDTHDCVDIRPWVRAED